MVTPITLKNGDHPGVVYETEPVQTVLKIGTVDCETLAVRPNAVVYEVALLVADVDAYYRAHSAQTWLWHIEIWPQVAAGRFIDPNTVTWALGKYEDLNARLNCADAAPPGSVLADLRELAFPLDELWINKSSFDYSVLATLSDQFLAKKDLWKHKAELDLRTLYRKLPLGTGRDVDDAAHTAARDVQHNLATLQAFGRFLQQRT